MIKQFQNSKNKVCIVLILLIMFLLSMILSNPKVFAETNNNNLQFEKLDLEEELKSISTFDFINYPPVSSINVNPSIYKVIEYCYSYYANYKENYGLYVYIYNPNQKEIIQNGKNKITLATKYKTADNAQIAIDYEKFDLKFVSKTNDAYNNLFYKFKVVDHKVDGKSMYERVNKDCRQYDISEIELQEKNNLGANLLCSGGRFKFTGYAAGYGSDSEDRSTLKCTQEGIDALELELNHTWFRTPTSSYGKGYQNQLDAVYFSVPNNVLEEYGSLKQIKANWYEYKTSPIVVLHDKLYYDNIKGKEGIKDSKLWALGTNYTINTTSLVGSCDWGFNMTDKVTASKFKSDFLAYIYYCDAKDIKDFEIKSKELRNYIYSYNKSYHTGKIDVYSSVTNTNISNDLFVNSVDNGHTRGFNEKIFDADQVDQKFNLLNYESNHSGWQKFKDYFDTYPKNDQSYTNISPIMEIERTDLSLSDEDFSKKYLVDIKQVSNFKDYVRNTGDTVFKFNFGFSQYESNIINQHSIVPLSSDIDVERGVMCQETVYLDFDIIWLKFVKGLDETIVPVAALPIDAIADITMPPFDDHSDFWNKILAIIATIISLILFVLIVCAIIYFLPYIQPIFSAIAASFKATSRAIKDSKFNRKIKKLEKQEDKMRKQQIKDKQREVDLAKERFTPKKE